MKKHLLGLALASLLLPGIGSAGDWGLLGKGVAGGGHSNDCNTCLSYDYIDLEYLHSEYDLPILDGQGGYNIGFSKSIGCNFFINGSFSDYDYDCLGKSTVTVENRRYRFGAGVRKSISECVDLTFEGGFQHIDSEFSGGGDKDYDSWSYYVGPGVRARAGRWEVYAKAFWVTTEGDLSKQYINDLTWGSRSIDHDGWMFTPGIIFHYNDLLALKVGAEIDEFNTQISVGARIHY